MSEVVNRRVNTLDALVAQLPDGTFLTSPELIAPYSGDWSGEYRGSALAVARPRNRDEVSVVMAYCHANQINVVPQGGLTGLVGGAVPRQELVVSLERMDRVRSVSPIDFSLVAEAGCVLQNAKDRALEADCILPITFGAQGSCRIGGNIATNAGGFNVLRYGMTRDLVLGLEAVLPDGRIWNGLKTLRKNNTGYDLKQLFIGSEGTLGIITAAAFKIFPKPQQIETVLIGLGSVEDAMALYARARRDCSDLLTAFELILRVGIDIAVSARSDLLDPLSQVCPVYVLMEVSGGGRIDVRSMVEGFLADAAELIIDGTMASSEAQSQRLWLLRETMVEAQGRGGRYLRSDVSVSISRLAEFIKDALIELNIRYPSALPVTYGHVGDGNVHLNVVPPLNMPPEDIDAFFHAAEATLFEVVDRHNGSISAEHGIGLGKRGAFLQRVDDVTLDIARSIKNSFDPHQILSQGRIYGARATTEVNSR